MKRSVAYVLGDTGKGGRMIDRSKGKAPGRSSEARTDKGSEQDEKSAEQSFTLYGRGGRAWVERSWHGMSTSFDGNRRPQ
jgi:hypothetical protein